MLCAIARVDLDFIERPSPNFDERQLPVSMIVLHYTGMPDAEGALDRLTSPEAKVSSHYLVDEDGTIYTLWAFGRPHSPQSTLDLCHPLY